MKLLLEITIVSQILKIQFWLKIYIKYIYYDVWIYINLLITIIVKN